MKGISRTVWVLSLVSLFTDTASEMLYPVMPIYLKSIGFSIVLIGIFTYRSIYNSAVSYQEEVDKTWGDVQSAYQRRADLIPQLIETVKGAAKLREELNRLKQTERPRVINAIAEARAHGDLSENAEYDAAKDRQGFVEGRIQEVEGKLSAAQIIDPASVDAGGRVVFGATVELEEESTGEVVKYQIVGEDEADLKLGLINISSPIARALIGKEEGDVAVVQAPGGEKRYEIVAVSYI